MKNMIISRNFFLPNISKETLWELIRVNRLTEEISSLYQSEIGQVSETTAQLLMFVWMKDTERNAPSESRCSSLNQILLSPVISWGFGSR